MARELSEGEARGLLGAREVGRLGLVDDGLPYVVPIAYAYCDGSVYCHSAQGRKVSTLRLHPEACFEVDEVDGIDRWRSVIAWGTYEQLLGAEAKAGLEVLLERFRPAAGAGGTGAGVGVGAGSDLGCGAGAGMLRAACAGRAPCSAASTRRSPRFFSMAARRRRTLRSCPSNRPMQPPSTAAVQPVGSSNTPAQKKAPSAAPTSISRKVMCDPHQHASGGTLA